MAANVMTRGADVVDGVGSQDVVREHLCASTRARPGDVTAGRSPSQSRRT